MDTVNVSELNWLAGLLEGEGSFLASVPSEPSSPRIVVEMADRDVIEQVAALFGVGYIQTRKNNRRADHWKDSYRVTLKGYRAAKLMYLLYPIMGMRRKTQIEQAIATLKVS